MNEEVPLQITILAKGLVALGAVVSLASTVGLPMFVKALSACIFHRTQVTRHLICHLKLLPPLPDYFLMTAVEINVNQN